MCLTAPFSPGIGSHALVSGDLWQERGTPGARTGFAKSGAGRREAARGLKRRDDRPTASSSGGGCWSYARGSIWYFPGGPQPVQSHAKYLLLDGGLDRSATLSFRYMSPPAR